jgi:hypothetical protein
VSPRAEVAFLFDVDNTLLDNDRVKAELAAGIQLAVGASVASQFWELYEEVRAETEVVDYPATLERFQEAYHGQPGVAAVVGLVMGYPYETALYPGALAALAHVQEVGPAAIVTDGDAVPAHRYVLVDDKLAILNRVEMRDARVLTVHVRQGHYRTQTSGLRAADRTIERIGDLAEMDLAELLAGRGRARSR